MKRPFVQDIQQGVQGCYLCLHILASDRLTSIPQIPISSLDLSSTLDVLICYLLCCVQVFHLNVQDVDVPTYCGRLCRSTFKCCMLMFYLNVVYIGVPP